MNITAKMNTHRLGTTVPNLVWIKRPRLLNIILIIAVLTTAFGIIYVKDLNRRFFIQYQSMQLLHDTLYEERGKLLLEQSTWSSQSRIQKIATQRLGMVLPSSKDIVVIKTKRAH